MIAPVLKSALKPLSDAVGNPEASQMRTLRRIFGRNRSNRFWSWARDRRAVGEITPALMREAPVINYESILDAVEDVRNGEEKAHLAFGPSRIRVIGQTSGTTSEPKRFPLNDDFIASYRRFMSNLNLSMAVDTGSSGFLWNGKRLTLTARSEVSRAPCGMIEGFMSGQMALQAPRWVRPLLVPGPKILKLATWEEKLEPMLRESAHQNVIAILGVPSMLLAFSEKALDFFGVRRLSEVWPNLHAALFGGVTFTDSGRRRLAQLWQTRAGMGLREGEIAYWELYSATEGVFAHTWSRRIPGMVFNPRENFFQFREKEDGPFLHLHELRTGGRYLVYVTTPGGLVNYEMGDWIEILQENPISFRIYGRSKEELNLAGEKISIGHARDAIERSVADAGGSLVDFVFWIVEGNPNRLVCGIAVDDPTAFQKRSEDFIRCFDRHLAELNSAYEELRINDFIFGKPGVALIPSSVFSRYQLIHIDQGQFKGRRMFRSESDFRNHYDVHGEIHVLE